MRPSPQEIIHLLEPFGSVDHQDAGELDVPRSTFYCWCRKYQEEGDEGSADRKSSPRPFCNRIPSTIREQVMHPCRAQADRSTTSGEVA